MINLSFRNFVYFLQHTSGGPKSWTKAGGHILVFDRSATAADMSYEEYEMKRDEPFYYGSYKNLESSSTPKEISRRIRIYEDVTVEAYALENKPINLDLSKLPELRYGDKERVELNKLFKYMAKTKVCMGIPVEKLHEDLVQKKFSHATEGWFAKDEARIPHPKTAIKKPTQYRTPKTSKMPDETQRDNDCLIVHTVAGNPASSVCKLCRRNTSNKQINFSRRDPAMRSPINP